MNNTMQLDDFAMLLILTYSAEMAEIRQLEEQYGMKVQFGITVPEEELNKHAR